MADLRAKGHTLAQIAQQVGLSRQAVHNALKRAWIQNGAAICRHCRTPIPGTDGTKLSTSLLCSDCLAAFPRVSFAVRLMSLRISASLTQSELAAKTGVSQSLISHAERDNHLPRPEVRARLQSVLETMIAKRRRR